jgi:predicted RNase H-like nuclease (RuvC/YqgF family)
MGINKTEESYLIEEKKKNGLDCSQAYKEVEILNNSQKIFQEQKRKIVCYEQLQRKLNKEIENLKEKIKVKDKKIFDLKFKLNTVPKEKTETEDKNSIFKLKRLINLMELNKSYTKSDFYKEFFITLDKVDIYLKFLNDYKIIELTKQGDKYIRLK